MKQNLKLDEVLEGMLSPEMFDHMAARILDSSKHLLGAVADADVDDPNLHMIAFAAVWVEMWRDLGMGVPGPDTHRCMDYARRAAMKKIIAIKITKAAEEKAEEAKQLEAETESTDG